MDKPKPLPVSMETEDFINAVVPKEVPKKQTGPSHLTTNKDEIGKPGDYVPEKSGALVSIERTRRKAICEILGLDKKGYRKQIKAAKREHHMDEHEFQEYVFGLKKEMDAKAEPKDISAETAAVGELASQETLDALTEKGVDVVGEVHNEMGKHVLEGKSKK